MNVIYPYARLSAPKLRRFVEVMRELMPAALGDAVVKATARKGRSTPDHSTKRTASDSST